MLVSSWEDAAVRKGGFESERGRLACLCSPVLLPVQGLLSILRSSTTASLVSEEDLATLCPHPASLSAISFICLEPHPVEPRPPGPHPPGPCPAPLARQTEASLSSWNEIQVDPGCLAHPITSATPINRCYAHSLECVLGHEFLHTVR